MFDYRITVDASRTSLVDYVVIFADNLPPPREHYFTAISDDHARHLMCNLYRDYPWTLYRLNSNQRECVCVFPEKHAMHDRTAEHETSQQHLR